MTPRVIRKVQGSYKRGRVVCLPRELSDNVDGLYVDDIDPCFEFSAFNRDFCLLLTI